MKKFLQILLLVLITILIVRRANSQCDDPMRQSISISTEHTPQFPIGVNVRGGVVSQAGRLSVLMGIGLHRGQFSETVVKDGISTTSEVKGMTLSLSSSVGYKILHEYFKYSLHAIVSGHFYERDGLIGKGGLRLVIPSGYKSFFFDTAITTKLNPSLEVGVFLDL